MRQSSASPTSSSRGDPDGTSFLPEKHGLGRHSGGRVGAGVRAGPAHRQVALRVELSEVARHDLRCRGSRGQDRQRRHRRQVPDPGVRRGRNRSGPAGRRRRADRHGRVRPHGAVLLRRQGSDVRLRHGHPVRAQPAPVRRVVVLRRRRAALQRVPEVLRHHVDPVRQHRRADGRLVPQGDQDRRRPEGAQVSASGASRARC